MKDEEYNRIQNNYYQKANNSFYFWFNKKACQGCIFNTPDNTIEGCGILKRKCSEGLDGFGCKFRKESKDYYRDSNRFIRKKGE